MKRTPVLLALCVIGATVALDGCRDDRHSQAPVPSSAPAVTAEGAKVKASAGEIDRQTGEIDKKAPQVKPNTQAIGVETGKLRDVADQLQKVSHDLAEQDKLVAQLRENLAESKDQVKKLRSEHNSLLTKLLAGLGVVSIVGVVLCVWLLRDLRLAAMCGSLFVVSIAAEFLIQWAMWFALGIGAAIVILVVWLFVIQHKTFAEVLAKSNDLADSTVRSPRANRLVENLGTRFESLFKQHGWDLSDLKGAK